MCLIFFQLLLLSLSFVCVSFVVFLFFIAFVKFRLRFCFFPVSSKGSGNLDLFAFVAHCCGSGKMCLEIWPASSSGSGSLDLFALVANFCSGRDEQACHWKDTPWNFTRLGKWLWRSRFVPPRTVDVSVSVSFLFFVTCSRGGHRPCGVSVFCSRLFCFALVSTLFADGKNAGNKVENATTLKLLISGGHAPQLCYQIGPLSRMNCATLSEHRAATGHSSEVYS